MANQQFTETQPINEAVTFVAADGTALKTLLSTGAAFRNVDQIVCTNSDTIDHDVKVVLNISGTDYVYNSVKVPAGSGYAGVNSVDIANAPPASGVAIGALHPFTAVKLAVEVPMVGTSHLDALLIGADL